MPKRITMNEVAALAGVHKSTVSRALSPLTENQVNGATLRRVQRAARQLGFVPNAVARGLRRSASMTVGVIVPDLTNPVFPPMVRGIEDVLSPRGYTALLANTDGSADNERAVFETLLGRQVDGFIVGTGLLDHPLLREAAERDARIVLVNRGTDEPVGFPLVTGDDAAGIAAAVDHLVGLGHRRILHLAGPGEFTTSRVRADAFEQATRRVGVWSHAIRTEALSIAAGQAAMNAVLDADPSAWSAVVASNDLVALGAIRALRQRGLDCPRDLSVIGFNDMQFAEDFLPPLSSVHVPLQELGRESARLLLDGIEQGHQSAVTVSIPVRLVVRGSAAPPAERFT